MTARRSDAVRDDVVRRLGFSSLLRSRAGDKVSSQKVVRQLDKRTFMEDLEEFKKQENAFVEGVRESLHEAVQDFVRGGQWGDVLRLVVHSPEYSVLNNLWAYGQMRRRCEDLLERGEMSEEEMEKVLRGRFFSASAAKAVGARVKDEYFYRPKQGFDGRYLVEMFKPLGFDGFWKEEIQLDAQGKPVIDPKTQKPQVRKTFVPMRAKAFATFHAYHQDALELVSWEKDPESGKRVAITKPFVMPEVPWEGATGSEEDAMKLYADLEAFCREEKLTVVPHEGSLSRDDLGRAVADLPEHAKLDLGSRTITVDDSQGTSERAVALLRALCEYVGRDEPAKDDGERKVRRAAEESAKYAIASLYGLEAKKQTFPYLLELSDDEKALNKVVSDTHRRVQSIIGYLDPTMRARARERGHAWRVHSSSRKVR